MAPTDEEVESAREWLGAEHGGVVLPDELQQTLVAGFEAECWSMFHVTLLESVTSAKAVELFKGIVEDCAEETAETPSRTTMVIFKLWIQAHFDEDEGDEGSSKKYVPSEEEKEDLKAQGMASWHEMRHGEFALCCGRPGTDADIEGGEYRTPPYKMKGVIQLTKAAKNSGGFRTYDMVLAEAYKSGKVDAIERWFQRTGFELSKRSEVKHTRPGAIMLAHWMRARRQFKDDRALILYLKNYREDTEGRFFPREIDMEIVGAARDFYSSASTAASTAMEEQMKEVMDANRDLRREVQSLNARLRNLQTSAGGPGESSSGAVLDKEGRPVVCNYCKGNHWKSDCPVLKAKAEKEKLHKEE